MPSTRPRAIPIASVRQGVPLLGSVDGVNQTFSTPEAFHRRAPYGITIAVYYNGQRLTEGASNDYEVSESGGMGTGFDTVTLKFAPLAGDVLTADFTTR